MSTGQSQPASSHSLDQYKAEIASHVRDAETRLGEFEAKAREKGAKAEASTINDLKAAKQNIDRKLQDLKATTAVNVSRAKAEINTDVAQFKAAVSDFGAKFKSGSTRK
ncbi:MAG TPA: hypothetical protein VKE96_21610 [Vicinamibacterales bacterium]|nr:hypothetical protein [Vicinamibacterales bacterium]